MNIILNEMEEIYFSKTKEYFQEVLSSYSIGNYRSATVILYSVVICDLLFKLQELKDMYNDTIADQILKEVEKSRNANDNKSKSKWEKELIDNIHKNTDLLDLEAYTNLNHLYDHRNFSAHPALNENYELVTPSKETTIAHIKNTLNNILIKPPIFIKNVVDTLTEDLKDKKNIYEGADDQLSIYLNNKYYSKMSKSMKIKTMRAFWKFSFCLPEDEECMNNIKINRKALKILISSFQKEAIEYIKENKHLFSVANDDTCQLNLVILLSDFPSIYDELDSDAKLQIDVIIDKDSRAKAISWFKYKAVSTHLDYLKSISYLRIEADAIKRMMSYYSDIGEMMQLIDFFVWYYSESYNYDSADIRFGLVIEPFLGRMSAKQFEQIIQNTNINRQIWDRGLAYTANNKIMQYAKSVLNDDFDYSKYKNFRFDNKILNPIEDTKTLVENNIDKTCHFNKLEENTNAD